MTTDESGNNPPIQEPEKKKGVNHIDNPKLCNRSLKEIDKYFEDIKDKVSKLQASLISAQEQGKEDLIKKYSDEITEIANSYEDSDSFVTELLRLRMEMAKYNNNIEYTAILLSNALARNEDIRPASGLDNHALNKGTVDISEKKAGPINLSGAGGEAFLLNRLRGLCRIPLYDSGFWIVIRSYSLIELNSFFQSIDIDEKMFGRILGGHYYNMYDYRIKEAFTNLLVTAVVDSSLKDFDKSKVLEKAITLPDILAIYAACNYMLYRDGVEIDMTCMHEDCKNIEPVMVDLANIRFNNYSLLGPTHIAQVDAAGKESVTLNDCIQYRNTLNIERKIFSEKDSAIITCTIPSLDRYFSVANTLSAKLISGLHVDDVQDKKFVEYLRSLLPYIYLPWIERCELDVGTDYHSIATDDKNMLTIIEHLIRQNDPILAKIQNEFINKAQVSYFCYPGVKCSKCGRTSDDIKKDYYPADVQSLFFFLSSATLVKSEAELTSI